jgi:hypothetical protein
VRVLRLYSESERSESAARHAFSRAIRAGADARSPARNVRYRATAMLWTNHAQMVDVGFNWYLNKYVTVYFDW